MTASSSAQPTTDGRPARLGLNRNTLRQLTDADLCQVAGGGRISRAGTVSEVPPPSGECNETTSNRRTRMKALRMVLPAAMLAAVIMAGAGPAWAAVTGAEQLTLVFRYPVSGPPFVGTAPPPGRSTGLERYLSVPTVRGACRSPRERSDLPVPPFLSRLPPTRRRASKPSPRRAPCRSPVAAVYSTAIPAAAPPSPDRCCCSPATPTTAATSRLRPSAASRLSKLRSTSPETNPHSESRRSKPDHGVTDEQHRDHHQVAVAPRDATRVDDRRPPPDRRRRIFGGARVFHKPANERSELPLTPAPDRHEIETRPRSDR